LFSINILGVLVGTVRRNVGMGWKHGLGMSPDDGRGSVLNKRIRTYLLHLPWTLSLCFAEKVLLQKRGD
jgi:hypothetical protein